MQSKGAFPLSRPAAASDDTSHQAPEPVTKTYKRELASGMLLFLGVFFLWGVENVQAAEAARYMTLPVFTFAGGAFGMDAWAKQIR